VVCVNNLGKFARYKGVGLVSNPNVVGNWGKLCPIKGLYLCNAFKKKNKTHLIKINTTTRVIEWEK